MLTRTILILALVITGGCGTVELPDHLGENRQVGEETVCLPCYQGGDLGCVRVRVKEGTPRTDYQGKTYYFCSEQCRQDFEREPERYVSAGKQ